MLTAVSQKNQAAAKSYFDEHLCRNDYYAQEEIEVGRWIGLGAERLGLWEGQEVNREAFMALCDNLHPKKRTLLTQRLNSPGHRRIFYDFTCSAPKSVSILAVTLKDERLSKAHQEAARFALKELERYAAARIRERGRKDERTTSNMVGAEFLHNSSRALDPQLHTHFTLFNATFDPVERRWKALEAGPMFEAIRYATEVYRNDLSRRVHALGYETEKAVKGFEMKGVSVELRKKFSKRSAERDRVIAKMEKELGRKLSNNEVSHAVHQTRSRKLKGIGTEEVRKRQLEQLSKDEQMALERVKEAARGIPVKIMGTITEREALAHSVAHVFERASVVREDEILREALMHGRGFLDLERLKEWFQKSEEFVRVGHEVSTREILESELYLIERMNKGKDAVSPIAPDFELSSTLGKDQRMALTLILKSPDQFTGIRGLAGTGKSTALSELARALDVAGHEKVFCAPTGSAADVLRKDGFDAVTLQRLLLDERLQGTLSRKSVIVLDEAGAVGTEDMKRLFVLAVKHEARIVFSGDTGQHSAVARGDALRILEEHSRYSFGELTEIRRQKRADYLEAVRLASQGKSGESLDRLDRMGDVVESEKLYESVAAAYLDSVEGGASALVVAPTWTDIDRVTEEVRAGLRIRKVVRGREERFEVLDSLQWTAAQKRDVREYAPGMVLVFHKDAGKFGRHETVEVISTDHAKGVLHMRGCKGMTSFRPLKDASFDVCQRREIAVAPGDKLLLRANHSESKLVNGQIAEVKAIQGAEIALTDGRTIPKDYRKFCHGYAVTSHASQGKTVDQVLVVASSRSLPAVNQKQFYVSISRGRERCRVFTDDKELLRERVGRAHDRKAALELGELKKALLKVGVIQEKSQERVKERSEVGPLRSLRPLRRLRGEEGKRFSQETRLARWAQAFRSWVKSLRRKAPEASPQSQKTLPAKIQRAVEQARQRTTERNFEMER